MTDHELLTKAFDRAVAAGLTPDEFMAFVTWRDPRTGRRWRAGQPVPERVRERLRWYTLLTDGERRRLTTIVTRNGVFMLRPDGGGA